jgi:hypothetical protein
MERNLFIEYPGNDKTFQYFQEEHSWGQLGYGRETQASKRAQHRGQRGNSPQPPSIIALYSLP